MIMVYCTLQSFCGTFSMFAAMLMYRRCLLFPAVLYVRFNAQLPLPLLVAYMEQSLRRLWVDVCCKCVRRIMGFLIINQPDAQISQIYFGRKLYMFRTVPLSIIRSFSLYTQQWYMPYRSVYSFRAAAGLGWNYSSILSVWRIPLLSV
jgi:hypothetical protein